MERVEFLLVLIAIMLFLISMQLSTISKRLRQHFPTDKEQDYDWSQKDPMGHWEAHKKDKD
jgi:hypothetical protein